MKRMLIGWILTVLLLIGGGALAQEEHFSFILPDNENLASVAVGEDGTLFSAPIRVVPVGTGRATMTNCPYHRKTHLC